MNKFIVIALGFLSLGNASAGLPETISAIKPSIVGIGTLVPTRRPPAQVAGTGFAVADGRHVITNAHVVQGLLDVEKNETFVVFVGVGLAAAHRVAHVIETDREHDLALLKIDGEALPPLELANTEYAREGEYFAFTGFPIGAVLGLYPATHRGMISAITPIAIPVSNMNSLDAAMIKRLSNPFNIYQLDATAYPGNSGSPLYDTYDGRVVGVINMVYVKETKEKVLERPSGISYAIPVRYIVELLERQGLLGNNGVKKSIEQ